MFDIFCTVCGRHRLIFAEQVRRIDNDAEGIHVVYDCWCGARSVWTTGRHASPEPVGPLPPAA